MLRSLIDEQTARANEAEADAAELKSQRDMAVEEAAALRATLSWRITRPIRAVRTLARRGR